MNKRKTVHVYAGTRTIYSGLPVSIGDDGKYCDLLSSKITSVVKVEAKHVTSQYNLRCGKSESSTILLRIIAFRTGRIGQWAGGIRHIAYYSHEEVDNIVSHKVDHETFGRLTNPKFLAILKERVAKAGDSSAARKRAGRPTIADLELARQRTKQRIEADSFGESPFANIKIA